MKEEFDAYTIWCWLKGKKPSNPDSLKAYFSYIKSIDKRGNLIEQGKGL